VIRAGVAAILLLPLVGCGMKGAPMAPLRPAPEPVSALSGRHSGTTIQIGFTLPTRNAAAVELPIDLAEVEIYAVTLGPGAVLPTTKELLTRKYLVKSLSVKPLPVESEETTPATEQPKDDRPMPGERMTFVETLTAAELTPAIMAKPVVAAVGASPVIRPALDPAVPTRFYFVRGRSRGGEPGGPARLSLPLVQAPAPPTELRATVTEKAVAFEWTAPAATLDPVAAAANAQAWAAVNAPIAPPVIPARARPVPAEPLAPAIDPSVLVPLTRLPGVLLPAMLLPAAPRFNVYVVKEATVQELPMNPTPMTASTLAAGEPVWDEALCFVVRTVRVYGVVTIESEPAGPHCVTPVDPFPPAAPSGLKAVAVAGAMNLIWDANSESDLAGYLILRGEAPGETLQALTPTPIGQTNYTDTTVKAGVRYVYAIVAVDKASKANTSAQSPRVEETAR
jgi:hypothetical protein